MNLDKYDLVADSCIGRDEFTDLALKELETGKNEILCLYYDKEIKIHQGQTFESIMELLKIAA